MNITKIVLLHSAYEETVFVHVDFPSPTPGLSKDPLCMKFTVAYGDGIGYIHRNFKVAPLVMDYAGDTSRMYVAELDGTETPQEKHSL